MSSPTVTARSRNFYSFEPVLIAQLQAACPSIGLVEGAPDLWALRELSQNAQATLNPKHPLVNPTGQKHGAAFVIYWDETVQESRRDCDRASQTWLVAVVAKKHQKMRTGVQARQEDGALVAEVLTALRGWDFGPALAAQYQAALPAGSPLPSAARQFLKRVSPPLNRHQMLDPLGTDNGLVTTLLAYEAPDLIH